MVLHIIHLSDCLHCWRYSQVSTDTLSGACPMPRYATVLSGALKYSQVLSWPGTLRYSRVLSGTPRYSQGHLSTWCYQPSLSLHKVLMPFLGRRQMSDTQLRKLLPGVNSSLEARSPKPPNPPPANFCSLSWSRHSHRKKSAITAQIIAAGYIYKKQVIGEPNVCQKLKLQKYKMPPSGHCCHGCYK